MSKIIVVRSPEADFRPETYITQAILRELDKDGHKPLQVFGAPNFTKLQQSLFYDNDTMTQSFLESVRLILKSIEEGDVIFFADAYCPTIPALKFHLHCAGIKNVKLCGIFHSSVETPGDFLYTAGPWVRQLESTLLECLDLIFVATEYVRTNLAANTKINPYRLEHKVKVTELPIIYPPKNVMDEYSLKQVDKERTVIFSHRWAPDKNPQFFVRLANEVKKATAVLKTQPIYFKVLHPIPLEESFILKAAKDSGIEFVHCDEKEKYWLELHKASCIFSCAKLETFGYSVIDGIVAHCFPYVPRVACYPYLYNPEYMYDKDSDLAVIASSLIAMIEFYYTNYYQIVRYPDPANFFLPKKVFGNPEKAETKISDWVINLLSTKV